MAEERLQKVIAAAGIASRRHAEEIILAGRVTVNGDVVREMGTRVDAERDRIEVDGKPLSPEGYLYLALNKPVGVVTTASAFAASSNRGYGSGCGSTLQLASR